jgi:hypothetical protein
MPLEIQPIYFFMCQLFSCQIFNSPNEVFPTFVCPFEIFARSVLHFIRGSNKGQCAQSQYSKIGGNPSGTDQQNTKEMDGKEEGIKTGDMNITHI